MREFPEDDRVRSLQGMRAVTPSTAAYSPVICYREEEGRRFLPHDELLSCNTVSISLLAERLHFAAEAQIALEKMVSAQHGGDDSSMRLTPRQLQILHCIEQGWSNKLIAHHLSISLNTLKSHIRLLYRALGVSTRCQALIAGRTLKSTCSDPLRR